MVDGAGFAAVATDRPWVVGYGATFLALGVIAFRPRMSE
jgi:hypothetical protein